MRRLLVTLALSAIVAPVAAPAASLRALRTVTMQPLSVQGVRFRPAERVTVRVVAGDAARVHVVTASGLGTFRTTFTAVSLQRCARYVITARGSRGSSATLRRIFPDCAPR